MHADVPGFDEAVKLCFALKAAKRPNLPESGRVKIYRLRIKRPEQNSLYEAEIDPCSDFRLKGSPVTRCIGTAAAWHP